MSAEITLPVGQQNQNIIRPGDGTGAGGGKLGGVLRHRRDCWQRHRALSDAGNAACDHFCAGYGRLHTAVWRTGQKARTQNGLYDRHRGRRVDGSTGCAGGGARFVLAILYRGLFRRRLCGGGGFFPLCRHRRRQRRAARPGALPGHGGGVAAGVIGPMLVTGTMNLWPSHTFAMTFIAQGLVAALSALVLLGVKPPRRWRRPNLAGVRWAKSYASRGFPGRSSAAQSPIW